MECPKCHKNISDDTTVCPYCHKVLALTCPNCHSISQSAVCTKCGYIILEKCHKCGKMVPTTHEKCKCGFNTSTSIAYNECEIDEFASVIINFAGLKEIRRILGSQEMYAKFIVKLKNLLNAQVKGCNAHTVIYNDNYTVNFNRELSFQTSVNKAVRLSLKIATAFAGLNTNIIDQLGIPLKLVITIIRKNSEDFLVNKSIQRNVKLMIVKNDCKKHLQGMQVIIDQYCQDATRDYKTDSLYSLELDGGSVMFYELLLENYILPPEEYVEEPIKIIKQDTEKSVKNEKEEQDIYGFNVFDINAKCRFTKATLSELPSELTLNNKIVALRSSKELGLKTSEIVKYYEELELKPLYISCTEDMSYKPWGLFEKLFKEYYNLPFASGMIPPTFDVQRYNPIKDLITGQAKKSGSAEDARFKYMEFFVDFLTRLKKCVIIIDGFENIDDTSIQALELYFDKFMRVYTNFVFITDASTPVHGKIKGLLQTFLYNEITLIPNSIDRILATVKEDASNFINSFYFEKIQENFNGSKLYFDFALTFLKNKAILTKFDNKLLIKSSASAILPKDLSSLLRAVLKTLGKKQDASMILAFSCFLGERIDFQTLELLGINNIKENAQILCDMELVYVINNVVYINNYSYIKEILLASLKKEIQELLIKTIIAKLGKFLDSASLLLLMDKLSMFKEEYALLWKNAQYSISNGDYDSYLKNCLKYLSLLEIVGANSKQEEIEQNKKDIFQNILMTLYAYSPAKIYSIEKYLLIDAIESGNDEQIVRLSNLMLQGALLTSNYTEAYDLLHNILTRLTEPKLVVNGAINAKFLLLSLVNIEILFNIGDFKTCKEVAQSLLEVIKPDIIDKIKPQGFSVNSFVSHMLDSFRLVAFAKLITLDDDLEDFFKKVFLSLNADIPEKDCIVALKEFLAGKNYTPSNVELSTPFSKIVFLILQELSKTKINDKQFAQNIYQAKLLAADIQQIQLESICDILIALAYHRAGISVKADTILSDVLSKSEKSNIFNIVILSRYIIAKIKVENNEFDEALIMINDTLADIQRFDNQAKVFYAMFNQLFIDLTQKQNISSVDIDTEYQKLMILAPNGELERIIKYSENLKNNDDIEQNNNSNDSIDHSSNNQKEINFKNDMKTEVHE